MNELQVFMNAVNRNNELNMSKGYPSGRIAIDRYLYGDTNNGDNLRAFTRREEIREVVSQIDRNKLLELLRSKLIKEAIKITERNGITVDNYIINGILDYAIEYTGSFDFEDSYVLKTKIDNLIRAAMLNSIVNKNEPGNVLGSDNLMNALNGNIRITGKSNSSDRVAEILENFDQMIDPTLEQRIIFYSREGR